VSGGKNWKESRTLSSQMSRLKALLWTKTRSNRPHHPVVIEDRIQWYVMRLGLKVRQKTCSKPEPDGKRLGYQRGQHAVIKTAAITQPVAARSITHARHKQQGGHNDLGVLRFRDAVSVLFHRATGVPGMESHGFVNFVHHRQSNHAGLGLVDQFAVLFPTVQCRQGVEFSLDWPVGTNDGIRATHQPNAHDPLQQVGAL
jgi:hypothetical protein